MLKQDMREVSGDNYIVQASFDDWISSQTKALAETGIITAWKRVYIEKDKMFRRGGLLSRDASPGSTLIYLAKDSSGSGARLDNVQLGDKIEIFDASFPYEGAHDQACIIGLDENYNSYEVELLLGNPDCTSGYNGLTHSYSSSVDQQTHQITFANGTKSAGVGVESGGFYRADLSSMWQTFNDGFVEFWLPPDGAGAVPYVHWMTDATPTQLKNFSRIWWLLDNNEKPNYLHLLGIEDAKPTQSTWVGSSPYLNGLQSGASYIFVGKIIDQHQNDPQAQVAINEYCTIHELTHNFSISGITADTYHCGNMAWPVECEDPPHECIMNENLSQTPPKGMITYLDSPPRFCISHLFSGGSTIVDVHTSIRDQQDPLPY